MKSAVNYTDRDETISMLDLGSILAYFTHSAYIPFAPWHRVS